ncbi:Lecithin retinol acyltransferase [Paraburkholderia phenazinium]|uniref:Lecithin retinol acyltransferase n=1 Tax=Paraburkholderia phenazinium TaxID=60549 RepID=A0A1G7Y8F3_9BURK|nr:lecithin retinol acyltransferase family protein [Paraburkholderia phenazinium]SDG92755.1 Lecithin retinol acyltransferase [Paraburkholderia phenazinium]
MSDTERTIRVGDHLWVQRIGYEHHGLATGRGTVVQYSGKDGLFDDGVIEEVPLSRFAKGRKVRFVDHPTRLHSRAESVMRARQRIDEREYNLVFNNCEHFVWWCIEDKHTSAQVNRTVARTGNVAATATMFRWYQTSRLAGDVVITGRTVQTASQVYRAGRMVQAASSAMKAGQTVQTASSMLNAGRTAALAAELLPTVSTALGTSAAPAASAALGPVVSGLTSAGLTSTLLGGAGATAVGLTAPVSVPVLAVAAAVGLAVGALWSIFD